MFSYTDDAIVTSSPTGRHLSTVIRRPAAIGPLDWAEHADQVCKVLNELGTKDKALHLQWYGRIYRRLPDVLADSTSDPNDSGGPTWPRRVYMPPVTAQTEPTFSSARITELEKQLDGAATKLADAQKPIEMSALQLQLLYHCGVGNTLEFENRIFKRVE